MRVISGYFKGLNLKMPKGIRPTSDKVKEALFDVLGQSVAEAAVLDLFAGSGALGLEALSRGAKRIAFVDNNPRCIKAIEQNLTSLQLIPNVVTSRETLRDAEETLQRKTSFGKAYNLPLITNLYCLDAFKAINLLARKKQHFDLILLDPPYYKGLAKKTLITIAQNGILTENAFVVAEHYKKDELLPEIGNLTLLKIKTYGDTFLSFFQSK